MRLIGIVGWKNAGKTTLVERLVAEFVARGLAVSTVKHAHHAFDVDRPGKDSFRHRAAGATETAIVSAARWALMHELRDRPEPTLAEMLARLSPVDLVIAEGFKAEPHPKIEVHRAATGHPLIAPSDPAILAVASDVPLEGLSCPRLDLDDIPAIADFVLREVPGQ